jgi:hypothetical protein
MLYRATLNVKPSGMRKEAPVERRWFHMFSLALAPVTFALLYLLTSLNPIYSLSISMFIGALAATICRPDLTKNTWLGGALFEVLYFAFFSLTDLIFPNFTAAWNLAALSGILLAGVPIEELMFAFTFGMFRSGVYEHIIDYGTSNKGRADINRTFAVSLQRRHTRDRGADEPLSLEMHSKHACPEIGQKSFLSFFRLLHLIRASLIC